QAAPVLTLQGATTEKRRPEVQEKIGAWLKGNALAQTLGTPAVTITARPASLLDELRSLVARDTALDGLRVDRGTFDEENALVLSGLQDHDGQAEGLIPLVRTAAASAWPNLPPPPVVRADRFTTFALRPLLDLLARRLPYY